MGIFLCGVVCANIMGVAFAKDFGLINTFYMDRYVYTDTLEKELFVYLFYQRVPEMLLLIILSIGIYKTLVVDCYMAYICFSAGFLSVISIMNYGIAGIGLAIALYFPHWILYISMLGIWQNSLLYYKQKKKYSGLYASNQKKTVVVPFCIGMLGVFVCLNVGIFLESYVNPYILKWVIGYLQST